MTHYDTLGITKNAQQDEIKKAYRILSKKYHPDVKDTGDEVLFDKITKAYKILLDYNERAAYDQSLETDTAEEAQFREGESTDFYSSIFGKNRNEEVPRKGKNRVANVTVSFDEGAFGVTKSVTLRLKSVCISCGGTGKIVLQEVETCGTCGGSRQITEKTSNPFGYIVETKRKCPDCRETDVKEEVCVDCDGKGYTANSTIVEVQIPAGIKTGEKVRVKNYGEESTNGGDSGDLLITVTVEESSEFVRDGNSLRLDKEVSFTQLILGDTVEVNTLEGPRKIAIPPQTQPETEIKLKGYGVTTINDSRKGDLVVTLKMKMPNLTEEQKRILQSLGL